MEAKISWPSFCFVGCCGSRRALRGNAMFFLPSLACFRDSFLSKKIREGTAQAAALLCLPWAPFGGFCRAPEQSGMGPEFFIIDGESG